MNSNEVSVGLVAVACCCNGPALHVLGEGEDVNCFQYTFAVNIFACDRLRCQSADSDEDLCVAMTPCQAARHELAVGLAGSDSSSSPLARKDLEGVQHGGQN